jgi:hypothetical protein
MLHQASGLPAAFIRSGARFVFAARTRVSAQAIRSLFSSIKEEIRAGSHPAAALQRVKIHGSIEDQRWLDSVVLFEASN